MVAARVEFHHASAGWAACPADFRSEVKQSAQIFIFRAGERLRMSRASAFDARAGTACRAGRCCNGRVRRVSLVNGQKGRAQGRRAVQLLRCGLLDLYFPEEFVQAGRETRSDQGDAERLTTALRRNIKQGSKCSRNHCRETFFAVCVRARAEVKDGRRLKMVGAGVTHFIISPVIGVGGFIPGWVSDSELVRHVGNGHRMW